MNSSLVRRWRNADAIILAAVYGKRANTVVPVLRENRLLTRMPVGHRQAGFPFPAGVRLRFSSPVWIRSESQFRCNFLEQERMAEPSCLFLRLRSTVSSSDL